MAIDFQAEPFYDDYSEDNQFYRILYRPGYAVQARELTQMQTILQEQIRRHGDHIFKEGSLVIPGQIAYDLDVYYVKLFTPPDINTESVLQNLVGRIISNEAGVTAKVLTYERATGTSDPYDTIFVKFLSSAQETDVDDNIIDIKVFRSQEILTPIDGTTGLAVTVAEDDIQANPFSLGKSSLASIQRGVYYIKKHFVLVKEQTIVLDKYANEPTYRVGLQLNEEAIYPEEDESLLDNSTGSPNYAAPGAARYYMDLTLVKLDPETEVDEDFIDLLRLENGRVIHKIDRSQYAELEKTLARRTYDESGDYALNPFDIQIREYRNNYRGEWRSGNVYIQGDIIRRPGSLNNTDYFVATTNGISGNVALNWDINATSITDGIGQTQIVWEYVTVPNFNRGVYSFPAGDVKYALFTINDHLRLNGYLAVGLEKNKAYVRGYEIEKLATEYLLVEKSRDLPAASAALSSYLSQGTSGLPAKETSVSVEKNVTIDISFGNYIIADGVLFAPDVKQFSTVNLHSVVVGSATANTVIGTARVRALELHESGVSPKYKVFLFDIAMRSGRNFSEVKAIHTNLAGGSTTFRCNVVLENSIAVIKEPEKNSLVHTLPDYAIKEILEADYSVVASLGPLTAGAQTSGTISPTLPAGHLFSSISNPQNYIVVNTTSGAIATNATLALSNNVLTIGNLTNGNSYVVLATLQRVNAENNTFSYNGTLTDDFDSFTTQNQAQQRIITLDQSFVVRIVSVMMDPNGFSGSPSYTENITNRYIFNNGQTSNALNRATLELKPDAPLPRGSIRVRYEYVNFAGAFSSNFISVNSFVWNDSSRISYDQIPVFAATSLRDCIDFRPFYLTTGGAFQEKYMPKYGNNISIKYKHYMSRLDNISLTSTGRYIVSAGVPSMNVVEPNIPDNSMKIARIILEPYTFGTDSISVRVDKIENRRYTMRDIGKLERRIKDLEYYTSLSMLELDTKNTKIIDSNGFDRLQNGFIVDTFVDQSIGNVSSNEWNASIDSANTELRPFFSQKQIYLLEDVANPIKNYKVSGDLVSLQYTESVLIQQSKASTTENVNPYALYAWRGIIGLNPWSDTWFATERRPDIIVNDEGQYNALVAKAEQDGVLGTAWNSWQTVFASTRALGNRLENLGAWSNAQTEILNDSNKGGSFWRARETFTTEELNLIGINNGDLWGQQAWAVAGSRIVTVETAATETRSTRSGVRTFVVDRVDSRVLEDRVVETQVVPFIRSRSVLFSGFGFKPNTQLYAFFDGTNVNQYITQATKIKVSRVQNTSGGYFPHRFDTVRNAGSAVEDPERTVTNGAFEDVEIAFNHGEIVREINGNDNTAVVVGQEVVGLDYFIYVMNIKGSGTFSLAQGAYLRGEYLNNGEYPRVKVVQVMPASPFLTSSGTGVIFGTFKIPNGPAARFRTGTREFKLIDDPSNDELASSTNGTAFYEANGLIEVKQRTILSTRTAELVSEQVSEENTVVTNNERITRDTGWFDPLAQTFLVQQDNGAFLTSVDIFFSTIDENVPVRVEIREVVNGYPGSRVLPFSRVEKKGSSISTSIDGSVATNFKFDSPVYLQNGVEYALVVLSDSNQYRIFISQTDTIDLISGKRISSQPYNGVLFKSQNGSTWTADQTQDMKFTLYCAQFSTAPQEIQFITSTIPRKNLAFNPLQFTARSNKIRVSHPNHGFKFNDTVNLAANQSFSGNAINGIPTSEIFTNHTILSASLDDYVIQVSTKSTTTASSGGAFIFATENYAYQTAMIDIGQLEIPGTRIEYTLKTFDESANLLDTTGERIILKENLNFTSSKVLSDPGSLILTARLITDSANVSPIIDVGRCAITLVSNKVDNPDVLTANDIDIDIETMSGSENTVVSISRSTNTATVTTTSNHGFNVGQTVVIDLDNTTYTAFIGEFVITAVTDTTFNFVSNGANLSSTALSGIVTPRSTEIGTGKPFVFNPSDGALSTSTEFPEEFSKLSKLKPGHIIRLDYASETSSRYMVVTSKFIENDGTNNIIAVTLEPEVTGSSVRDTGTSETVDIVWMKNYVSEVGVEIGTVTSKYVTKKINLSRPSEMLRIMLAAATPVGSSIQVFYKTGISASADFLDARYIEASPSNGYQTTSEFIDYTFDVENLDQFDTFIVKLVMRSSNKASVPRIKDLRVIACAA